MPSWPPKTAVFYDHIGLDWRGIVRALLANMRSGGIRQGGSTITQQLAKNFFLTPERTLTRKLKEMMLALVIEARYDKATILEIYLNEIYFGQNGSVSVNGIGEASRFYFDKPRPGPDHRRSRHPGRSDQKSQHLFAV